MGLSKGVKREYRGGMGHMLIYDARRASHQGLFHGNLAL